MPQSPLYERDFYAFANEQAALLREGRRTSNISPRRSKAWAPSSKDLKTDANILIKKTKPGERNAFARLVQWAG